VHSLLLGLLAHLCPQNQAGTPTLPSPTQGKARSKMTLADKALADLSDDARAAVAAVDAAVQALPPTSELSMSVMPEGTGGANFGEERLPTNPGSKVLF